MFLIECGSSFQILGPCTLINGKFLMQESIDYISIDGFVYVYILRPSGLGAGHFQKMNVLETGIQ